MSQRIGRAFGAWARMLPVQECRYGARDRVSVGEQRQLTQRMCASGT